MGLRPYLCISMSNKEEIQYTFSGYLKKTFDLGERKKFVNKVADLIEWSNIKFDTLVVSGVSGIAFGSMVAYELNCNLTIIRKEMTPHSRYLIEGAHPRGGEKYIILDDCIASGRTIGRIINRVEAGWFEPPVLAGVFLYDVHPEWGDAYSWIQKHPKILVRYKEGHRISGQSEYTTKLMYNRKLAMKKSHASCFDVVCPIYQPLYHVDEIEDERTKAILSACEKK